MTQEDFNTSFNQFVARELDPGIRPEHIAFEIFRRDQCRARIYAILSLFFWLIGTAGMMLLVYGLNRLVIFLRIAPLIHAANGSGPATQPWSDRDEEMLLWGTNFIHRILPYVGGAVIALLLAALFTVLYVSSSRQATLTRINISLMQMSEELKRLKRD